MAWTKGSHEDVLLKPTESIKEEVFDVNTKQESTRTFETNRLLGLYESKYYFLMSSGRKMKELIMLDSGGMLKFERTRVGNDFVEEIFVS